MSVFNLAETLRSPRHLVPPARACLLGIAVALLLAGCVAGVQTPDGSTGIGITAGAVNYHFGGATGCAGAIADYQAVIDNDKRPAT